MQADIKSIKLTVLMPCLNEAETLETCILKAITGIKESGLAGEILIADNGSNDGSQLIAKNLGARVIDVETRGYGSALRAGIEASYGEWIVMGDADDSYDFSKLKAFTEQLEKDFDLVMGCRLPSGGGTVMPGAMPWKHRWIGNPVLTFIGKLFFRCPVNDFHCGLRGFKKKSALEMDLQTSGMEFASEMVIKANLKNMAITQVPITLHKDGRSRPPHLRSWRDGWRHLRFMLIYSPRWLFLIPGLTLFFFCGFLGLILYFTTIQIGFIRLDTGTMLLASMGLLVGAQMTAHAISAKVFAIGAGLLPPDEKFSMLFRYFNLEKGIVFGLFLLIVGLGIIIKATCFCGERGFGEISYSVNMRNIIAASTLLVLGIQTVFVSFFLSVLGLKTKKTTPPDLR